MEGIKVDIRIIKYVDRTVQLHSLQFLLDPYLSIVVSFCPFNVQVLFGVMVILHLQSTALTFERKSFSHELYSNICKAYDG